jgi:hypothetical protein
MSVDMGVGRGLGSGHRFRSDRLQDLRVLAAMLQHV